MSSFHYLAVEAVRLYFPNRSPIMPSHVKNYLILLAGIIAAGSSVFFIKASHLAPASLSATRLLIAALVMTPFLLRACKDRGETLGWKDFRIALPAAIALVLHYVSWFVGVRETTSALSTLIGSMNPVFMPFLVFILLRERINTGEIIGSIIAIGGVCMLAMAKDDTGTNTTRGIVICIVSILFCSIYLALGRRYGRGRSIFVYMVPLYWIAGFMSLLTAVAMRDPAPPTSFQQILIAFGTAIVPTVIGHTALNHAMIHLPSQVVSISNLGQFIFVVLTILIFPSLGEQPTSALILPAILVLGGSYIVMRSAPPTVRKSIEHASTEPAGT